MPEPSSADRQVAAIDRHFLTIEDAAQLIGHGVSTLRRWITDGHLKPAGWVGRRAYYTERAILDAEHATRKRRAA